MNTEQASESVVTSRERTGPKDDIGLKVRDLSVPSSPKMMQVRAQHAACLVEQEQKKQLDGFHSPGLIN